MRYPDDCGRRTVGRAKRKGLEMRFLPICLLVLAIAAPADAQEKSTLQHMIANGSVLKVSGMEFPTTYTPDGKFTAADGQVTGTWRIVGETLCVTTNYDPNEAC